MSHRALALGVVDRLRAALSDADGRFVFYQPDLRPPPGACTERSHPFLVTVGRVSAARGPTAGGDVNDLVYTAQVCVTAWVSYAPFDRLGHEAAGEGQSQFAQDAMAATGDGILDTADLIAGWLIEDWDTVNAANRRVAGFGTTTNGFCEPFHTHAVGDLDERPLSWVGSEGKSDTPEVVTVTVTVAGARRIRARGTP